MKLQDQLTNLELSKELKKLGVKQESLFWWIKAKRKKYFELALVENGQDLIFFNDGSIGNYGYLLGLAEQKYSAFTTSELFKLMPVYVSLQKYPKSKEREIGEYRVDKWSANPIK